MNIYISGKITGLPIQEAKENFRLASVKTRIEGNTPVDPMIHVPVNDSWEWIDYMKEDIKLLMNCDAIFMLSNWKDSKGAKIEHDLAVSLGMLVFYQ